MNVKIGAEAALFPEKEYIIGIFVAVRSFWLHFEQRFLVRKLIKFIFIFQVEGISQNIWKLISGTIN
jgi:hypothetical protein